MTTRHQKTALTALAGLSLLGFVTGCATDSTAQTTETTAPTAAAESTPAATGSGAGAAASTSTYKDGEYKAEGSYTSPGGPEKVGVSLTLAGDVITAVTVTPESENPNGKKYQGEFADGISSVVVGKSIDDIKVSKVAGSSLTSGGFNDAVDQIKAEATA
ncbi:FMN-binding protein [Agreia sp. COWG]|uniref:FMN-binding protein n=1 Tax=Agreia sp. COWG TaxID=2773266 RepID=UPI0019278675|nr:FMN-binding protein [Agreia sp. COWG]CAD5995994.1 conserved exported protein of unknown function [Agreia sp. COWG]